LWVHWLLTGMPAKRLFRYFWGFFPGFHSKNLNNVCQPSTLLCEYGVCVLFPTEIFPLLVHPVHFPMSYMQMSLQMLCIAGPIFGARQHVLRGRPNGRLLLLPRPHHILCIVIYGLTGWQCGLDDNLENTYIFYALNGAERGSRTRTSDLDSGFYFPPIKFEMRKFLCLFHGGCIKTAKVFFLRSLLHGVRDALPTVLAARCWWALNAAQQKIINHHKMKLLSGGTKNTK
jgi:hypothetical protein